MNYFIRVIRPVICVVLVLYGFKSDAQVSILQNTIDKLEWYKNLSYHYTEYSRDATTDTDIIWHKDILQKAPGDKNFDYLFSLETQYKSKDFHVINLYNGKSLITIAPEDSTCSFDDIKKETAGTAFHTLIKYLKWIKARPARKLPITAADTTINGVICCHLVFDVYDTTINQQHVYTLVHVFINKQSVLPVRVTVKARQMMADKVTDYYSDFEYSDYKFDEPGVDIALMDVPKGFHLPNEKALPLLTAGTAAPGWTLCSTDGRQLSLAALRGKVVLMDFFFIGCEGCMASLPSLDKIYEKYKGRDFMLVSISDRDSRKAVTGFKKNYDIKNAVCSDGANVAKAYHLPGAPLFYCIDKEGKIANVTYGYDDGFEAKTTKLIDSLLGK